MTILKFLLIPIIYDHPAKFQNTLKDMPQITFD